MRSPQSSSVSRLAGRDEGERPPLPRLLQHLAHARATLVADVAERRGLEDDRQRVRRLSREHLGQLRHVVTLDELGRIAANGLDRLVESPHPVVLARPDERAQQPGAVLLGDVDRRTVDPDSFPDARLEPEQFRRDGPPLLALEAEHRVLSPPLPRLVAVRVPIPDEVEPGARPELDQVERLRARALGHAQQQGQQHPGALNFVRLHALRRDELPQERGVLLERIVPGRFAAEHEVVQPAEQPQRRVPRRLRPHELGRHRVFGPRPQKLDVELRAALALGRLVQEDVLSPSCRSQAPTSPARRSCRTRPGRRPRCLPAPCGRARSPPCGNPRRTGCTRAPRRERPR